MCFGTSAAHQVIPTEAGQIDWSEPPAVAAHGPSQSEQRSPYPDAGLCGAIRSRVERHVGGLSLRLIWHEFGTRAP